MMAQKFDSPELKRLKLPGLLKAILRFYFYFRSLQFRRAENKRFVHCEEVLLILETVHKKAEKDQDRELIAIYNKSTYLLTIEYDVAVMKQMMLTQFETWGQQVVGRQFVVLLYEGMNDLPKIIGKDLEQLVKNLPNKSELLKERDSVRKNLAEFKKKYESRLKELRNFCGAHRDNNAHEQLKHIRSITIKEIAAIAAEFMLGTRALYELYQNIMSSMTRVRKSE